MAKYRRRRLSTSRLLRPPPVSGVSAAMDGYPPGSLDHNVPFLVASGLSSSPSPAEPKGEDGVTLKSDMPCLEGVNADVLHAYLQGIDATRPPWTQRDPKAPYRYRVASVGRVRHFPSTLPHELFLTLPRRRSNFLPATRACPTASNLPKRPPSTRPSPL